jgi:hypothetical protein
MPLILKILFLVFGLCGVVAGGYIISEGLLFYRGTVTPLAESKYFVGSINQAPLHSKAYNLLMFLDKRTLS